MLAFCRQATTGLIYPAFNAAFTDVPVVFDNDAFDFQNPPKQYLDVETKAYGAGQVGISADPKTRFRGYAYFCMHVREGTGDLLMEQVIAWLRAAFEYRYVNGVHYQAFEPQDDRAPAGWATAAAKVPFYTDPT